MQIEALDSEKRKLDSLKMLVQLEEKKSCNSLLKHRIAMKVFLLEKM